VLICYRANQPWGRVPKNKRTNLLLIGETTEILTVRIPCNEVCIPGTELRVLVIARDLPPLESEAGVDTKHLTIEVPGTDGISENELPRGGPTYSVSFPADCQPRGKFMEGMGHAGQSTASSPGEVPSIPAVS
jgi:hypothetical protein